MKEEEIKKILEDNKEVFDALEEYDETGKLPEKMEKRIKEKTGKPIFRIIEEKI